MSASVSFGTANLLAGGAGTGPRPPAPRPRLLDRLETLREPAGVALLRSGERLEPLRHVVETLVASGLGEARVHLGVLVSLAGDRRLQVVRRRTDLLPGHRVAHRGQEVEVPEGVPGLALGDGTEQRRHVRVALHVRLLG